MIAVLTEFDPPVEARVVADQGDSVAVVFRHPEGWECRSVRRKSSVTLRVTSSPTAEEAGRILDRLRGPERYYLACAMTDARALLKRVDGRSPRNWAGMAARLEELRW